MKSKKAIEKYFQETFPKRVKLIRTRKDMRQIDVASKGKFHKNWPGQVEIGAKTPSLESFARLCQSMDLDEKEVYALLGFRKKKRKKRLDFIVMQD